MKTVRFICIMVAITVIGMIAPNVSYAKSYTGCKIKNLQAEIQYTVNKFGQQFRDHFPKQFSFDEKKLIWINGDEARPFTKTDGFDNIDIFGGYEKRLLLKMVLIDKKPLGTMSQITLQFGYFRDTRWMPFTCSGGNVINASKSKSVSTSSSRKNCGLSKQQIKETQSYLKGLNLYRYKIDGILGKGTLAGIKEAKRLVGQGATKGQCITQSDIALFKTLLSENSNQGKEKPNNKKVEFVSTNTLTENDVLKDQGTEKLTEKEVSVEENIVEKRSKDNGENEVSPSPSPSSEINLCTIDTPSGCTHFEICQKATIVQQGVRSWNKNQLSFVNYAKDFFIDCKINTPERVRSAQRDAVKLLSQLTEFVSDNPGVFDIEFAKEFNEVRPITQGQWDSQLSESYEGFLDYMERFQSFQEYVERNRLLEEAVRKKRKEQLRGAIARDLSVLKEWANSNVLDEKAVQVAVLDAQFGNKDLQYVPELEKMASEIQRLLTATGINDVASTRFRSNQADAVKLLSQLTEFVSDNPGVFDIEFAKEFNEVRPITQGQWDSQLSKSYEGFLDYMERFQSFQEYVERNRLIDETVGKKRREQLRGSISQDLFILKEWANSNVLDEKGAQIVMLDTRFNDQDLQTITELEKMASEAQQLLAVTGINDGPAKMQTQDIVDSLYNPSSTYLFANVTGNASHIYKDLYGRFAFEQGSARYCASPKLDAFDYYLIQDKIDAEFDDLDKLEESCSPETDLFILKGNELTSNKIFDLIDLKRSEQVFELPKANRDRSFNRLVSMKEKIKKDVMGGIRGGYGLISADNSSQNICGVIDGLEKGHRNQLSGKSNLLIALGYPRSTLDFLLDDAEEAFKLIQRGQCGAIYGSSLTLGRLQLAGRATGVDLEFMPVWITDEGIEASQLNYDRIVTEQEKASAQEKQNLQDQSVLAEQKMKTLSERSEVKQRKLRDENALRFMVLKDALQEEVFKAIEVGFGNPDEESGYFGKLFEDLFADQASTYSTFDGIIGDMQTFAAEGWEITDQRLEQIDYGNGLYNARQVDAVQLDLKVEMKNRLVGRYSEYCRRIHVLKDEDFDYWRNFLISNCDAYGPTVRWKVDNTFESKWIVAP